LFLLCQMHLFPIIKVSLESPLNDDEIVEIFAQNLESRQHRSSRIWITPTPHRLFEGDLFNYHFNINKVYKNSGAFTPIVTGRIRHHAFNSTIEMEIRYKGLDAALLFLVGIILSFALIVSFYAILSGAFSNTALITFLAGTGVYFLFIWLFNRASNEIINHFTRLFDATRMNK